MAKKKAKLQVGKIVAGAAALLGLIAFCMLFAPQLAAKKVLGYDTGITYTGINVTFGKENVFSFSFPNLLTYIFALLGIVFAVLALLKGGKLAAIISAAAFIAAGVFFFCTVPFTMPYVGELTGDAASSVAETARKALELAAGAIVGGVFSLLAGLAMLAKLFIKN